MKITTITQVHAECDMIANLMVEKGIPEPHVGLTLKSGGGFYVYMSCSYKSKILDGENSKFIRGDTVEIQFKAALDYIQSMPSPEEAVGREYLRHVSKAIDYATEHSIDDKHVAPLRGVSKAMTDNLLSVDKPAKTPPERINA